MSVNKHREHVLVLPEDDANRQIANGFVLDQALATRSVQVLEEAGGWNEAVNRFLTDHVAGMERYPGRSVILLIDFDRDPERLGRVKARIPSHLSERVYILGAWSEPEDLKNDLGSYEGIGLKLAEDCREGTEIAWGHRLLRHNASELGRLRERVRPIVFQSS